MPVICGQSIVVSCQRIAPRVVASRSDHLNEQWVCSANDRATDKYLVFALEKVLKLVRRCFGPPPKCLPEISGITEAKAFGNVFHS
jgi:hypothetical protein